MAQERTAEHDRARTLPLDQIQERLVSLLESDTESGVADAVDVMISQGAYHGASDLHFEPWADGVELRLRLDGMQQQMAVLPRQYQSKIMARRKVLARLSAGSGEGVAGCVAAVAGLPAADGAEFERQDDDDLFAASGDDAAGPKHT